MGKSRVFFAALLLAFTVSGAAGADDGALRFMQGVVSSHEYSSFVLNESQRVNINQATAYYDSQGRQTGIQVLAELRWLYVEGAPENDGSITAEKVYSLPGYINKKNRSRYGFMQLP